MYTAVIIRVFPCIFSDHLWDNLSYNTQKHSREKGKQHQTNIIYIESRGFIYINLYFETENFELIFWAKDTN
jgi:hypothetical protein